MCPFPEYMDDYFVHARRWPIVVASLALRLDRLLIVSGLRIRSRADRYNLPHPLCCGESGFLWGLGFVLAYCQPCCHGYRLVRCTSKPRYAIPVVMVD